MSEVLFVCVHNAGRSQMAKALFNRLAQERGLPLTAESTGTEPAQGIHANVAGAMREIGLDLSTERPKRLTNDMVQAAHRIITIGCAVDSAACPAVSLKDVGDWGLPDPKGKSLEEVRAIPEMIRCKVEELVASLKGLEAGIPQTIDP